MRNFKLPDDYDKVLIVCYPPGAGGNFLMNCLALADDGVFLDAKLARQQLDGQFDLHAKQQYLSRKLNEAAARRCWSDLDLGNEQFFGVSRNDMYFLFPEILAHRLNVTVEMVIKAGKKFFISEESMAGVDRIKKLWPNAGLIVFVNFRKFVIQRKYHIDINQESQRKKYWNTIKSDLYPPHPPKNLEEFYQLQDWLQQELIKQFHGEISQWFDLTSLENQLWHQHIEVLQQKYQDSLMIWDVDKNFASSANLIDAVKAVRQKFGIESVPDHILDWYYREWRTTIALCGNTFKLDSRVDNE